MKKLVGIIMMKKVYLVIAVFTLIGVFGPLSRVSSQTVPAKPKLNVAIFIFDGVQIITIRGRGKFLAGDLTCSLSQKRKVRSQPSTG